jgi:hypothetical protein
MAKVSYCKVLAEYKVKWLVWWNSDLAARARVGFPLCKQMKEKLLDPWLQRASFWAQVRLFARILNAQ